MADFSKKDYTTVNFAVVDDITAEWDSTVTEFQGAYQKASPDPTFIKLEELGYSGGFPGKFDTAMESLVSDVNQIIAEAKAYFENLKKEDASLAGLFPEEPGANGDEDGDGDKKDPGGGGGGGKKDNSKEQIEFFKDMSLSDLKEIVAILTKYAQENGISLDELLNDPKYADAIKELLLSSPKISESYKELLEVGSGEAAVIALKSLLNGDVQQAIGLTDSTKATTKAYLTNIAKANNISYEDLISKEDHSKILKKALADMKSVSDTLATFTESNIQAKLTEIINGTYKDANLTESAKALLQTHLESLSKLAATDIKEILTEESFRKDLYTQMTNLDRFITFTDAVSNCKDASSIMANLKI